MSDSDTPSRPQLRILLVDDSELNRQIIGRILEAGGHAVDLAGDGEQACAATWSKSYDLVLMDIEMPGMNGLEAAARIRAREGVMSGVTIAALTATRRPDAPQYAFWSGIDTFIAKPIEPKLLLARVAELTAHGPSAGNDWKPVWRLAVFAKFTGDLEDEAADALDELAHRLAEAADAVDAKDSASPQFFRAIHDLRELCALLGFEEMAGLCAQVEAERGHKDARCRGPNLLGAIERARYALAVYQREHQPPPASDWWARTRVNVQSLFKGVLAAGEAARA